MSKTTFQQQRAYRACIKAMGISDEDRRDFLQHHFGVRSTTGITFHQMGWVLDVYNHRLGRGPQPAFSPDGISIAQLGLLDRLAQRPCPASWTVHPAESIGLMRRVTNRNDEQPPVECVRDLSKQEASRFITAVQKILK